MIMPLIAASGRRSRVLYPACALLSIAARAGLCAPSAELEARFLKELNAVFAAEAPREPLLAEAPVPELSLEDIRPYLGAGRTAWATLRGNRIILDSGRWRPLFDETAKQASGASEEQVLRWLAIQYLPLLAHELRHRLDERLAPVSSASFILFEKEWSAYLAEAEALGRIHARHPEAYRLGDNRLTRSQRGMRRHWARNGPDGLKEYEGLVRDQSKNRVPSIWKEEDIKELKSRIPQARWLENIIWRCEKENADGPPPSKDCLGFKDYDAWLKRISSGHILDRNAAESFIAQGKDIGAFLGKVGPLREYFKGRECAGWKVWCEEFSKSCRDRGGARCR